MRILFLFLIVFFMVVVVENYNKMKIYYILGFVYKKCWQVKNLGMVVFVVKDGQVVFLEVFGVKNFEIN